MSLFPQRDKKREAKKGDQFLGQLFEFCEVNSEVVSNGWMAGLECSRADIQLFCPVL